METTSNISTTQNKAFEEIFAKLDNMIKTNMVWDNEISLSGAAGTGKTYLTTKLVQKLQKEYRTRMAELNEGCLKLSKERLGRWNHSKI